MKMDKKITVDKLESMVKARKLPSKGGRRNFRNPEYAETFPIIKKTVKRGVAVYACIKALKTKGYFKGKKTKSVANAYAHHYKSK